MLLYADSLTYISPIQDQEEKHRSELAALERQSDKRLRVAEKTADQKLADIMEEMTEMKKDLRCVR